MTALLANDHADRCNSQSSHEQKRLIALRWLTDNGKHICQRSFRYVGAAQGSKVLAPIRRRAR